MTPLRCPHCQSKHPNHVIGVQLYGAYDGVLYWQCAECRKAWHRWPDDDWRYRLAVPYIDACNQSA